MNAQAPTITADQELLIAIAGGEAQALRTLCDRHAPWLSLRFVRRWTDPDLTDSAPQDTFVAVWRQAGRDEGLGSWLRRTPHPQPETRSS